jgi:hypothetical protein
VTAGAFDGAKTAVTLALGLIGIMALWLGVMRLAGTRRPRATDHARPATDHAPPFSGCSAYVAAVYFGSVSIKQTRHSIPAGLLGDLAGVIASVIICRAVL